MRLVKPEWYMVPQHWPEIEGYVRRALAHGSLIFTSEDIRAALLHRQMQLWLAVEGDSVKACAVTVLETYRRVKICVVVIIGGEGMDGWIRFHEAIEAWAADEGCNAVEGFGRRGWQRVMRDRGYDQVHVVYRKMLRRMT